MIPSSHGVNKSKPKTIPRMFESRVAETIARAKKTVQAAQNQFKKFKLMREVTRENLESSKHKRRA